MFDPNPPSSTPPVFFGPCVCLSCGMYHSHCATFPTWGVSSSTYSSYVYDSWQKQKMNVHICFNVNTPASCEGARVPDSSKPWLYYSTSRWYIGLRTAPSFTNRLNSVWHLASNCALIMWLCKRLRPQNLRLRSSGVGVVGDVVEIRKYWSDMR